MLSRRGSKTTIACFQIESVPRPARIPPPTRESVVNLSPHSLAQPRMPFPPSGPREQRPGCSTLRQHELGEHCTNLSTTHGMRRESSQQARPLPTGPVHINSAMTTPLSLSSRPLSISLTDNAFALICADERSDARRHSKPVRSQTGPVHINSAMTPPLSLSSLLRSRLR
jgi:hypothetical protein